MAKDCAICGDDASAFILAEYETEGPLTGKERVWEDYGYLCPKHVENAEDSDWEIVKRGPPEYEPAECEYCGYEWDYDGNLQMTTCPSCQRKTEVGNTSG